MRALLLAAAAAAEIARVFPPLDASGTPAGLILVSGAQIAADAYAPLVAAIQAAAAERGLSMYVGLPSYLGNVPNPVDLPQRVADVEARLQKAGLQGEAQFFAAHSLGTVFLQDFVKAHRPNATAQLLLGGFLLRSSRTDFPVPTLTIGAELDGLARVTRIAEAAYHAGESSSRKGDFPVALVKGMNHMQFASGAPPPNVAKNDLVAELEDAEAHAKVGALAADFFARRLGMPEGGALAANIDESREFFAHVDEAFELEGSRRFSAPAQVGGAEEKRCTRGLCPDHSPWAPRAQELISQVDGLKLKVSNSFVALGGSPVTGQDFHLPNVTRERDTLKITTYSQCYWNDALHEVLEDFDTGFTFLSAEEIGTKLYSRQCTLNVGMGENASFAVDDPDFCRQTNELAYQWALDHVPPHSLERFRKSGIPLTFAADIQKEGGPLWLYARLKFSEKTGKDGTEVMEVAAVSQRTEQDYWQKHFPFPRPHAVPDPGCYHYCKLLSPARAVEWILVDGLRRKRVNALIV
jgi:hypothetical protein